MLPYRNQLVTTPLDLPFEGKAIDACEVVGVSVLRSSVVVCADPTQ